ncbi:dienelactone hydrolase family protein [Rhodococcus aerolatus]
MPSPKDLVATLSKRGPHRVLRGDLALAGLPGVVMTPEAGLGLPGVAFGHGWLQPTRRYLVTLTHLASWGIVAAAPATSAGPFPSALELSADLESTLDVLTGVRLGPGRISVAPGRLALAGHSFGAGAAVLAAARRPVAAVVGVNPAAVSPSATDVAPGIDCPALFVGAGLDDVAPVDDQAGPLSEAWGGPAQVRVVSRGSHLGFCEGRHWTDFALNGDAERKTQKIARAVITAFLLRHLTGDDTYDVLLDPEVEMKGTSVWSREDADAAEAAGDGSPSPLALLRRLR